MTWTVDPLERRRTERDRLLARAHAHVERLAERVPVIAAVVAGSVARGDFNVWSDIDVVVVSDALPAAGPVRARVLAEGSAPRVELHGYTSAEFACALGRGDRLAREAAESGVPLMGSLPDAE
jgi:uncharacterized protein